MQKPKSKIQTGFALLIFLVMLMGIGGIVLAGYSQGILKQVEESKFEHNQRVLKEAKQALLQFAYNYPVTNGNGPGRLPCPDTDNDGLPNAIPDCSPLFGRLPWNHQNLNLYDIRDADGERLWYAVSKNFLTNVGNPDNIINSAAFGTITLRDQSGNVVYDGSHPGNVAKSGVAALIIAPGDITNRNGVAQDRSIANADNPFDTIADTDPGIINATNYLDQLVGTEDNANFIQESAANGFILGPVNIQSTNAINDQFIVITAAEVIEAAEKATLQAYRQAISDYLNATGGVYPWLYNYMNVPNVPGLSSYFPVDPAGFATELATNLGNFGRIPSIFDVYFTETPSDTIETELGGSISWGGPATVNGYLFLNGPPAINLPVPKKIADVSFVDIPDVVGNDGQMTATFLTPETLTYNIYFWEYDHNEPYIGGWSLCALPANQISDCSRDASLNPTPGLPNLVDLDIIRLVVALDFTGVTDFNMNYANAPAIAYGPATGIGHASISGTYAGADIISLPFISATYERDEHYHDGGDIAFDPGDGPYEAGLLNMADFGRGPLSLDMRYYPELPDWGFDNNWHNSVMMAYANDYRPDVNGAAGDCNANPPCIQINGLAGTNNDKISILTLAGEHDWADGDSAPQPVDVPDTFFNDEVDDIFNPENSNLDNIFDIRTVESPVALGDTALDKILVINEL